MPNIMYGSELAVYAREFTPADLDFEDTDVDLTDIATTKYVSPVIAVGMMKRFILWMNITNTGTAATTGTAEILADLYAADGTTLVLPTEQDLITAINTKVTGQLTAAWWGWDITAAALNGTIGAQVAAFQLARYIKFTVHLTEANDAGTTATANLRFMTSQ
jgi:electron transfer flavoprotein alpha/beta subunit